MLTRKSCCFALSGYGIEALVAAEAAGIPSSPRRSFPRRMRVSETLRPKNLQKTGIFGKNQRKLWKNRAF
jgi:hypothetical protein